MAHAPYLRMDRQAEKACFGMRTTTVVANTDSDHGLEKLENVEE